MASSTGGPGRSWSDQSDHASRLAGDRELFSSLRRCNFSGPVWQRFVDEALARYGFDVVQGWLRTGRIVFQCRVRGIRCSAAPAAGFDDEAIHDLASDTVVRAIEPFREALHADVWSATRGASLLSFFVGQCLFQFPGVYRTWLAQQQRIVPTESLDVLALHRPEELVDVNPGSDPAWVVVTQEELEELLELADLEVQQVLLLRHEGYSYKEIAQKLRIKTKDVDNDLARYRRELRQRQRGTDSGGRP
jgi:hypothetical protein